MKICARCKTEKPLSDFYHQSGRPISYCKPCQYVNQKEWYEKNKEKKSQINRSWRERNSERRKLMNDATNKLWTAIRAGKITRGQKCEICGSVDDIEGAHWSYDNPLEVKWLCSSCHRKWDAEFPKSSTLS